MLFTVTLSAVGALKMPRSTSSEIPRMRDEKLMLLEEGHCMRDQALEPGELFELVIDTGDLQLKGGQKWSLDLVEPGGGHTEVSRTLPPLLQPLMPLYW